MASWRDSVASAVNARINALLGVSAYAPERGYGFDLDDPTVVAVRQALGGNIQPLPTTRLRWYLSDLERAQAAADTGDIAMAAQLYRSMRRDGTLIGLLRTLTEGVIALPRVWSGDPDLVSDFSSRTGRTRPMFDDLCPPSELALMAADGAVIGVGVGELVPVEGRDFPVLVRLEPEFLFYRWVDARWYYRSTAGLLPITPGDGRWVLHVPGGRLAPWTSGLWPALGRAFINKEHAMSHRSNYGAKLANPARAAVSPQGATEPQRAGFLAKLIAWGMNTTFDLPPGWDVKLIESKGEGYQVFQEDIDAQDREYAICIAGQVVTVDGGAGFSNTNVHQAIQGNRIKAIGDGIAFTCNTQILPQVIAAKYGEESTTPGAMIAWDTKTPQDLSREAATVQQVGQGVQTLDATLQTHGYEINFPEMALRYGIPIRKRDEPAPAPAPAPDAEPETKPTPEHDARHLDFIQHEHGKWNVYSEAGKLLGSHETKAGAEKQLAAVEASKHA